jgi:hypothetical protein
MDSEDVFQQLFQQIDAIILFLGRATRALIDALIQHLQT